MHALTIDINDVFKATLIFVRIFSMCFFLPFIGEKFVPFQMRFFLSLSLSFFVFDHVPIVSNHNYDTIFLAICVSKEIFVGFTLGFLAKNFFEAFMMAASIVGYQMGFGTANVIVPGSDHQISSFVAFHRAIVTLIFLALNFHHIYFSAIFDSFEIIPLLKVAISEEFMKHILLSTADIFKIGIQLSAPVLIALMLAMSALGMVARTVPSMNVFTISFPVSFFTGLGIYVATLPFLPDWLRDHYISEGEKMLRILTFAR